MLLSSFIAVRIFCINVTASNELSDLLKDESSEVDLVGPTLLALKTLLEIPVHATPSAQDSFSSLVHGLLSVCIRNIDEMRYVYHGR